MISHISKSLSWNGRWWQQSLVASTSQQPPKGPKKSEVIPAEYEKNNHYTYTHIYILNTVKILLYRIECFLGPTYITFDWCRMGGLRMPCNLHVQLLLREEDPNLEPPNFSTPLDSWLPDYPFNPFTISCPLGQQKKVAGIYCDIAQIVVSEGNPRKGHALVRGRGLLVFFLWLVDLTAMVFSHVLFATPFLDTPGDELCQQILASSFLKFALVGKW